MLALAWTSLDAWTAVRHERVRAGAPSSRRARFVLGGYVLLWRVLTLLSFLPALRIAGHAWPAGAAVAGLLALATGGVAIARRAPRHRSLHAISVGLVGVLVVDAWVVVLGRPGECAVPARDPAIRTLVRFRPVSDHPDPLLDERCRGPRTLALDEGLLLVVCGVDPGRADQHALLRLDPDHPERREEVVDAPSYAALPVPETGRILLSAFGRDTLVSLDRATLAIAGEQSVPRPVGMVRDGDRVLAGVHGRRRCLVGLDPTTGAVVEPAGAGDELAPSEGGLATRPSERHPTLGLDCSLRTCSPHSIVPLPEHGRVLVTNYVGPCTWRVFSHDTLELVDGAEWKGGARDALLAPDRSTILLALPRGEVAVLDAGTARPVRTLPTGVGTSALEWHPGGDLLVGNYLTGTLTRVEPESGTAGARVRLGSKVRDLLLDPDRRRLYALSRCGVYDLAPDLVETPPG